MVTQPVFNYSTLLNLSHWRLNLLDLLELACSKLNEMRSGEQRTEKFFVANAQDVYPSEKHRKIILNKSKCIQNNLEPARQWGTAEVILEKQKAEIVYVYEVAKISDALSHVLPLPVTFGIEIEKKGQKHSTTQPAIKSVYNNCLYVY